MFPSEKKEEQGSMRENFGESGSGSKAVDSVELRPAFEIDNSAQQAVRASENYQQTMAESVHHARLWLRRPVTFGGWERQGERLGHLRYDKH